jgi:glycosyltransferase involved in cell wall biosynthesis
MAKSNSKIVVVTTLYNSENYIKKCIESMQNQNFSDFHCYITDDLSTDKSVEVVKELISSDNRFTLIQNTKKYYQPGNYDQVIRSNEKIDDEDIIIEVDGDDWLPDDKVFDRIYNVYKNENIWIANGSFMYHNNFLGFSSPQKDFNNLRNAAFTASHIRTWRAFLWREILEEDLKDEDGEYWKISGDLSFMFPMLEMSGEKHYRFMNEINYVYNEDNPLNDHKVDIRLVNEIAQKIRKKEKYPRI